MDRFKVKGGNKTIWVYKPKELNKEMSLQKLRSNSVVVMKAKMQRRKRRRKGRRIKKFC